MINDLPLDRSIQAATKMNFQDTFTVSKRTEVVFLVLFRMNIWLK